MSLALLEKAAKLADKASTRELWIRLELDVHGVMIRGTAKKRGGNGQIMHRNQIVPWSQIGAASVDMIDYSMRLVTHDLANASGQPNPLKAV
jgi:hypothetical protein